MPISIYISGVVYEEKSWLIHFWSAKTWWSAKTQLNTLYTRSDSEQYEGRTAGSEATIRALAAWRSPPITHCLVRIIISPSGHLAPFGLGMCNTHVNQGQLSTVKWHSTANYYVDVHDIFESIPSLHIDLHYRSYTHRSTPLLVQYAVQAANRQLSHLRVLS